MASGKIIPKYYPILTYLGVDLIDSSYLLYLSAENLYNSTEYFLPIHKLKYPLCNCLACKGNIKKICEGKRSDRQIEDLTFHNLNSARDLMRKIKQYLLTEDFRAFVEKSSLDDTKIISLLKILDKEHFSTIQSHTKLIQKDRIINCLGESSYYRPDFVKYRKKVVNNFNPESFTNFLLLLPCSAKKPYSESQSHKKYNSILRKFSEYPSFQELILTSPLGVIPRQLENLYPVNSYNISVTGYWSQEEIEICGEMLLDIIQKYPVNIPVICHLDGDYQKIANYVEEKTEHEFIYSEIIQKPTNKESLESLRGILENEIKERKTEKKIPSNENFSRKWYRKLVKIIDYYFGRDIGENLMNHCNYIKKDYRHNRIELFESKRENKLGTFKFSDGFLYLTINGAQKIAHLPNFSKYIVFDGDKLRGNTFFRPGVKSIGKDLLPDDPVVIFNSKKQKVLAVGKMVVSSEFITNSKSGRIAKIYESK